MLAWKEIPKSFTLNYSTELLSSFDNMSAVLYTVDIRISKDQLTDILAVCRYVLTRIEPRYKLRRNKSKFRLARTKSEADNTSYTDTLTYLLSGKYFDIELSSLSINFIEHEFIDDMIIRMTFVNTDNNDGPNHRRTNLDKLTMKYNLKK